MTSLLVKVKSKAFVRARRKSRALLEGEYASVFHGRSLDYDDLRAYVPGDEVRDIDWKATARHGTALVKRYVAIREQRVLLVVDSGRGMAAAAESGEVKSDVAIMACGIIGYLALRHGDKVGLLTGSATGNTAYPFKETETHLELMLRAIQRACTLQAPPSDLASQLDYAARSYAKRLLLVVVADDRDLDPRIDALLRRLRVQHEILWLTIADADPTTIRTEQSAYDVGSSSLLPAQVRSRPQVRQAYAARRDERIRATASLLDRHGIMHTRVGSSDVVIPSIFRLLERQRRARR